MKFFSGLVFPFLMLAVSWHTAVANPIFRSAGFHHIFNGTDYRGPGAHLGNSKNALSGDGKVVALLAIGNSTRGIFIHNFDSQEQVTEVTIPPEIGTINLNAGLVSNQDGSRMFFVAMTSATNDNNQLFCMLNAKNGAISVVREYDRAIVEEPVHIATDAAGSYLYFNESDNGDAGDLWRIDVNDSNLSTPPELVIDASSITHPSGGRGRFIGQFDVSDDGSAIAFFVDGNIDTMGAVISRFDRELFAKDATGTHNLTHDDQDSKYGVRISGNGSTIVYHGKNDNAYSWMVTNPNAGVNTSKYIEEGYHSCGPRPVMTQDGQKFFARSAIDGFGSCDAYLINTDGSGRQVVDTPSTLTGVFARTPDFGMSADGSRFLFGYTASQGSSTLGGQMYTGILYPQEPHANLWPDEVPEITAIDYPAPLATRLDEPFPRFEIRIGVADPIDVTTIKMGSSVQFANGYTDAVGHVIRLLFNPVEESPGMWAIDGEPVGNWVSLPNKLDPVIARFSVRNTEGNVAYADVILQAAEADCSGDGNQQLRPSVVVAGKDVSCITSGAISVDPGIMVRDGVLLYLSGKPVSFSTSFQVRNGGGLSVVTP
jgi:hypothetical protein